MKDIFELIKLNTKTFEEFRRWLFIKLNKNTQSFTNFGKYPNNLKLPYLIEFLESKEVNILEAMCYYHYKGSTHTLNFELLLIYLVVEEFKRIENNIIINYTPF